MSSSSNFKTPLYGEGLGVEASEAILGIRYLPGNPGRYHQQHYRGTGHFGTNAHGRRKIHHFQVPALAKEGLCLSSLRSIALMKDQVQNLKKRGIKRLPSTQA